MILAVCVLFPAAAANEEEEPQGDLTTIESDRDGDGSVDYLVRVDDAGRKTYEELDFNYDSVMDDFYYYSAGVLLRREIDTNYDEEVDVWVYIHEGVYIERYERDLDFDGIVDQIKDFSAGGSIAESN